ncbi:hypothetical protein ACOXXX_19270 [Thalassococcus sp. BH17M4-6]|uniref:hypothetical protein n=1 Tax=Thalassococcus sp. BH17M4-6 TaxID=3413148 RepID=UPI003BC4CEE1
MTVFGARQDTRIGGKPRFLGLMLTTALLVFLVGVAAWASVFLDDGLARFFRPDTSPDVAVAQEDLPRPTPEPEAAEEPVELAALSTDLPPESDLADAPEALTQPARPRALTQDEADATYAATGIWQRAPAAPSEPPPGDLDGLYVASIDPGVQQFDAIALPSALSAGDPAFVSPPVPAPADVIFDIDDRGLVRARPEGAMNADGVLIYAGLPPVVPPRRILGDARPDVALPQTEAEDDATRSRLQGLRPQARPDDIVERNERATLQGRSMAELAALRPTARPDVEKLEAEADVTATAQAVDTSRKPLPRPRDIARIVEAARAKAASAPAEAVQVAAVAPRTVAPKIPSKTTVAQQATVKNALNLRKVNLIGVYGKPSSRRALVRLSNGRYQKVKVGDRVDGGRVAAIGESELRYTKGGRSIVLKMPRG